MKLGDAIEIYVRDYPAMGIRANPPPPTPMVWAKGLYLFEAMSIDKHYVARMYLGRWVPVAHEIDGEHIRIAALDSRPTFVDVVGRAWRKEPNGDLVLDSDACAPTPDEWLRKLTVESEMRVDFDKLRDDKPAADEPRVVLTLPQGQYKIDEDGYITVRLLVSQGRRRP